MPSSGNRRTVLIGLDGATFTILEPLMQDGIMPYLKSVLEKGVGSILYSTAHPLTPPAWTTLMTGQNPGTHGIYDFVSVEWRDDHPQYKLLTFGDIKSETVWSIASRQGCRVTSLNFPCMFPPPEINGFVMPGFIPWRNLPMAVHPRSLYKRLKSHPAFNARDISMDWDVERKALQGLPKDEFEPWIRHHIQRERQWFEIVRLLMKEEPCDLTAILFDGTDKLQHLCFALLDPAAYGDEPSAWEAETRELALGYFRELDQFISEIIELGGPEARVFMASDHGFSLAGDKVFYANVWLQQNGYLTWAEGVEMDEEGRLTLDDHSGSYTLFDWGWDPSPDVPGTTAFALTASSNGIFIRVAEKPGGPGVPMEEYVAFRERLRQGLLSYQDPDTGDKVVSEVLTREEAFPGGQTKGAPDLTLRLRDRSFLSVLRADSPLKPRRAEYGTHHPEGVFIAYGPGIKEGERIAPFSIADITPTLLYSLGLPIPEDLEGQVNLSAFEEDFAAEHPVTRGPATVTPGSTAGGQKKEGLTQAEEAEVLERLQALGYLE